MDKKVTPAVTLSSLEAIIEGRAEFIPFGKTGGMEYLKIPGYEVDFTNWTYKQQLMKRMSDRLDFVKSRDTEKGGMDALPPDAAAELQRVVSHLQK